MSGPRAGCATLPAVSRKWALGIAALAAAALAGLGAAAVFGGGTTGLPAYAGVEIELQRSVAASDAGKQGKPRILYLQGEPTTIDVDSTGPYVDVGLLSCPGRSRVIDGSVVADNTNVYQQGAYLGSRSEYHVRLGFDDEATPVDFKVTSHLICVKGAR